MKPGQFVRATMNWSRVGLLVDMVGIVQEVSKYTLTIYWPALDKNYPKGVVHPANHDAQMLIVDVKEISRG
jgi:hypothetical protein